MLSVKQGGIKYHFLSLWYDSTGDLTHVSRAIGEIVKVSETYENEIRTDHFIPARRTDLELINKKKPEWNLSFRFFLSSSSKSENQTARQILGPSQRTKKKKTAVEHVGNTNCSWCTWNSPQKLGKVGGRIGN